MMLRVITRQKLFTSPSLSSRYLHSRAEGVLTRLGISRTQDNLGVYDGQWTGSGPTVESLNPTTGEVLASVRTASVEDTQNALDKCREAYRHWRMVPSPKRGEILRQIRNELEKNIDDLGALVTLEVGKILPEGVGEVQEFVDVCDYATGLSRSMGGQVIGSERPGHFIMEIPNPLGVVGVVSAFNFPVAVYGWNLALSLVSGNSTLWKGSETTPLCSVATARIVSRVLEKNGVPGAVAGLVQGNHEVGKVLAGDSRVDLMSFTGSEAVGREVGKVVQGRFGKTILELGGNNASIVMPDANIDLAVRTIVFAAIGTAGMRCTSTRRLLLHSSISHEFLEKLKAAYQQVMIGDPLEGGVLCGPLHSKKGVQVYEDALKKIKQGGEILVGGKTFVHADDALKGGNFVEPTIVLYPKGKEIPDIMKCETFAPILHVVEFDTLEEAIEINNGVEQGLSSSLFTKDIRNVFHWTGPAGSDCGIVNVNQSTSGAEIGAGFGGNKSTGWGRESGGDAWKQYVRFSSCTINHTDDLPLAQGIKFS